MVQCINPICWIFSLHQFLERNSPNILLIKTKESMVNPKFPWLYNLNNPVGGLKVSLRSTYMDPLSDFRNKKKIPSYPKSQTLLAVFFGFSEPLCAGTIDGFPSSARSPKWSPWCRCLFSSPFEGFFKKTQQSLKGKPTQKKLSDPKNLL